MFERVSGGKFRLLELRNIKMFRVFVLDLGLLPVIYLALPLNSWLFDGAGDSSKGQ